MNRAFVIKIVNRNQRSRRAYEFMSKYFKVFMRHITIVVACSWKYLPLLHHASWIQLLSLYGNIEPLHHNWKGIFHEAVDDGTTYKGYFIDETASKWNNLKSTTTTFTSFPCGWPRGGLWNRGWIGPPRGAIGLPLKLPLGLPWYCMPRRGRGPRMAGGKPPGPDTSPTRINTMFSLLNRNI